VRRTFAAQPRQRGGQVRVGAFEVMRVAAALDKGAHCADRLRLAEQDPVHAPPEDLAEVPGIEADIGFVDAVDRRLDHHRGGAVARAGRPGLDQPLHVFGEPGHVEGAVLHADVDVVGPGARVLPALRAGQHMPRMAADIIDRLVLCQELDGSVDPARHDPLLLCITERHANTTAEARRRA
jgi:hypothetical protein